jgi:hypothetical protein
MPFRRRALLSNSNAQASAHEHSWKKHIDGSVSFALGRDEDGVLQTGEPKAGPGGARHHRHQLAADILGCQLLGLPMPAYVPESGG